MKDVIEFILFLLWTAGVFQASRMVGWFEADEHHEDEAVKHGKAEYYLDENNERKWRWK